MDLMVRIDTADGDGFLGWVASIKNGYLSLELVGDDRDGWRISIPWEDVTELHDATEFMTRQRSQVL